MVYSDNNELSSREKNTAYVLALRLLQGLSFQIHSFQFRLLMTFFLLLNLENDGQLLLLSCSAIVAGKQTATLMRILKHIEKDVDKLEREKKLTDIK